VPAGSMHEAFGMTPIWNWIVPAGTILGLWSDAFWKQAVSVETVLLSIFSLYS